VLTQNLKKLIDPYFLRRTKEDVGMVDLDQASANGAGDGKYVRVVPFLVDPVETWVRCVVCLSVQHVL